MLSIIALITDGKAQRSRGMSISALVVSIIAVLVSLAITIAVIVFLVRSPDTFRSISDCMRQAEANNWSQQQLNDCTRHVLEQHLGVPSQST